MKLKWLSQKKRVGAAFFVLGISIPLLMGFGLTSILGIEDDLEAIRSDANARIEQLTLVVDKQLSNAIKAVPGERWLQHIDAIYAACEFEPAKEKAECESRKNAAKQFLVNVAQATGIDFNAKYQASVWLEPRANASVDLQSIELDFYPTYLVDPRNDLSAKAVEFELRNGRFNPHMPFLDAEVYRPMSAAEIDNQIQAAARRMFDEFISPTYQRVNAPGPFGGSYQTYRAVAGATRFPADVCSGSRPDAVPCFNKFMEDQRAQFVTNFQEAVIAPYTTVPLKSAALRASEGWDILAPEQHLVVLIREGDWRRIKDKVDIYAAIHKEGDVQANYPPSRRYRFVRNDFDTMPVVVDPSRGRMVWAVHWMVDSMGVAPSAAAKLEEARKQLELIVRGTKASAI